jgi:antitoxin ParD1/3/4
LTLENFIGRLVAMRTSMNITLPETMKAWVDEQVDSGGYGTPSEYIRELVRKEQKRALREEINANLLASVESPASPMTQKDWEEIRQEGKKLAASRKKKRAK